MLIRRGIWEFSSLIKNGEALVSSGSHHGHLRFLSASSSSSSSPILSGPNLRMVRYLSSSLAKRNSDKCGDSSEAQKSVSLAEDLSNRFCEKTGQFMPMDHGDVRDDFDPDDDGEHEIYQGILSTQIKLVKTFSLTTSLIGLASQPLIYYKIQTSANVALAIGAGTFISFFTFATPLLIHWISKKYVTKVFYNRKLDAYTAVTYNFWLRHKKVQFKPEDVVVPDIPGMFTTFKVNNTPMFVDAAMFSDIRHFGKIMGYDKPLTLHQSITSNTKK